MYSVQGREDSGTITFVYPQKSSLTVSINFVFIRLHGTKAQVVILDTGTRIVARLRITFAHDIRNRWRFRCRRC